MVLIGFGVRQVSMVKKDRFGAWIATEPGLRMLDFRCISKLGDRAWPRVATSKFYSTTRVPQSCRRQGAVAEQQVLQLALVI